MRHVFLSLDDWIVFLLNQFDIEHYYFLLQHLMLVKVFDDKKDFQSMKDELIFVRVFLMLMMMMMAIVLEEFVVH